MPLTPYIPRFNPPRTGGGGDSLYDALDRFKSGIQEFNMSRAINSATEQLQNMQLSDTSDSDVRKTQNQIAFQLGNQALASGFSPGYAQAVSERFQPPEQPKEFIPQNEIQLAYASAKARAQAGDIHPDSVLPVANNIYLQNKQAEADFKKKQDGGNSDDDFKRIAKEQQLFSKFTQDLSPDARARGALSQSLQNQQKAQNLIALLGDKQTVGQLDDVPRQFVAEAATALATMVKNGQVTEGEIHQFLPQTAGMTKAKIQEYITSAPQGANAGKFLQLYLSSAKRESALSAQTVAESLLAKAQGNSALLRINPQRFKQELAAQLNANAQKSLTADDILVENGKVTTTEQKDMDRKYSVFTSALGEAKMKLNSQDPEVSAKAQKFFKSLGLDPEDNVSQMRSVLKTRLRSGIIQ